MHQQGYARDQAEIQSENDGGSEGVDHAALEDEVDIHQAVAEDGVAEGEWQQGQRQRRNLHGCAGQRTH